MSEGAPVLEAIVLEAIGIEKSYGPTRALRDGNLVVRVGEIHAIVGENGAGKSTLMNVLSGAVSPDAGTLRINGEPVVFRGPQDAISLGITIVHQELALCPDVSVAENVFIDHLPRNAIGLVKFADINKRTRELLAIFDSNVDPRAKTEELSIADQQVVEIAHALSHDCKVIIFDEPTSSLTETETVVLHDVIRGLSRRGIASIYISHRLSEIFGLSDRVTVMRDGRWVETVDTASSTPSALVEKMVGREVGSLYPPKATNPGRTVLEVRDISGGLTSRASFHARAGEILGVSGLIGSGRTELMRAVVGVNRRASGEVVVDGIPIPANRFDKSIDAGLGYMSEDRKEDGLFLSLSIENNVSVAVLRRLARFGMLSHRVLRRLTVDANRLLGTKFNDVGQSIDTLSGGNQQKAMIAKWLVTKPKVLILDEPTRGIDVGAKFEIHKLLRELAESGLAIVVISSELEEVIGLSDRILVLREGEIVGALSNNEIDELSVIALAAGTAEPHSATKTGETR